MIQAITDARPLRYLGTRLPVRPSFAFSIVPRDGNDSEPKGEKNGNGNGGLTDDQVRRLIREEGKGDSHKTIRVLARDRHRAAEARRKAEQELADLKTAGRIAPEKDFVILAGDDAKAWPDVQKFVADGKLTLPKLLELAKTVPDLQARVQKQEIESHRADAASELGWNKAALAEVLDTKGLALERRDQTIDEDGKKVKVPVWMTRKAADEKGEWMPLAEYADENLKVFLPALTADAENGETSDRARSSRQGADSGTRWPDQSTSRTPQPKGRTDAEIRDSARATGFYNL